MKKKTHINELLNEEIVLAALRSTSGMLMGSALKKIIPSQDLTEDLRTILRRLERRGKIKSDRPLVGKLDLRWELQEKSN